MYGKICPGCGAHLDPGEKCSDCIEKGLPHANENSPEEHDSNTDAPADSIARNPPKVKIEPLRELRISHNIPGKDMIEVVKAIFPKYDKMLQSKCERSSEYGVRIRSEALDALYTKYAPELLEKEKRRRRGGHRLTCKISCRLEDDEYNRLIACIKDDGFDQMQAWLTYIVRNYLKKKGK